jgi:uncharacterized protein YbjT (DUF2867 family)
METETAKQRILLTGATGYIGRRLKLHLLEDTNVALRLLVRHPDALGSSVRARAGIVKGSTFEPEALAQAMEGIDVAYYLIHSLGSGDFAQKDRTSAVNFRDAAIRAGVKKIVYLGGLGVKEAGTSEHLLSRIETGELLSARPEKIDVLWFRAGVIIGSGSASFEIIRNLIQKLPVMITPKWVGTRAQPIGVDDVVAYLNAARTPAIAGSHTVDIGAEVLSYREMMRQCAEVMGLKRLILPVPFLSVTLSSYWLNLFTPVPYAVARSLIEGLGSEVVVQNDNAARLFPGIRPVPFKRAVAKALNEAEENQVISRWSDRGGDVWETDHGRSIADAVFVDRKTLPLENRTAEAVFKSVCSIGGKNGWFAYDPLWKLRGLFDKLAGGAGLNRGRRSQSDLRVGDSLDFWKVVDVVPDERLLLYAQMKLPGKAWLEFRIDGDRLVQSAYFIPKGLWGRLYWYALIPLHALVFRNMIRSVLEGSAH